MTKQLPYQNVITYEAAVMSDITESANVANTLADAFQQKVAFYFNGVNMLVDGSEPEEEVVKRYRAAQNNQDETVFNGPVIGSIDGRGNYMTYKPAVHERVEDAALSAMIVRELFNQNVALKIKLNTAVWIDGSGDENDVTETAHFVMGSKPIKKLTR